MDTAFINPLVPSINPYTIAMVPPPCVEHAYGNGFSTGANTFAAPVPVRTWTEYENGVHNTMNIGGAPMGTERGYGNEIRTTKNTMPSPCTETAHQYQNSASTTGNFNTALARIDAALLSNSTNTRSPAPRSVTGTANGPSFRMNTHPMGPPSRPAPAVRHYPYGNGYSTMGRASRTEQDWRHNTSNASQAFHSKNYSAPERYGVIHKGYIFPSQYQSRTLANPVLWTH